MKTTSTRIYAEIRDRLKALRDYLNNKSFIARKSMQELLSEAVIDLCKKYGFKNETW